MQPYRPSISKRALALLVLSGSVLLTDCGSIPTHITSSLRRGSGMVSGNVTGITSQTQATTSDKPGPAAASSALPGQNASCQAGPAPLQRLTTQQYVNAALGLLHLPASAGASLVLLTDQKGAGPFAANNSVPLAANDVYLYMAAAESLSAAAQAANFAGILPCDYSALNASCVTQFIASFGAAAWRRALTADDTAIFTTAVSGATAASDWPGAVKIAVQTALDAPDFLYVPQLGATPGSTTLSQTEIAAKLAFALWNAPPDQALLAAAAAGQLTASGTKTQVARMIADPQFGASAGYFLQQLLAMQGVGSISKDSTLFPNYTPALSQAIEQESRDFASYVFIKGDARLDTLLTANFSVLTPPLFAFYGIPQPADWVAGQPTPLPSTGSGARRGILTQAAYQAAHAHPNATNVVERGKILRANLMCSPLPSPPNNVPPLPPRVPGAQTARQTFAVHEANASCASCHKLMDPLGLSFEHFDATGAWRQTDGALAIDASGSYSTTNAASANFTDGLDLAGNMATNVDVQNCVVLQTFRFITQRMETDADSCQIQQLQQHFATSGHDLRALMVDMVTSNLFATFPGGGS